MAKSLLSVCTLFSAVIFLFGCDPFESSNRYELVASSQGYVYRLDKKTGDISVIEQDTIKKVSEGQINRWIRRPDGVWVMSEGEIKDLVVGSLLKTEDGKIIRYVGKGNFDLNPIPPRKPGETIPEYLKRTEKQP
jgi:hypothetical protein